MSGGLKSVKTYADREEWGAAVMAMPPTGYGEGSERVVFGAEAKLVALAIGSHFNIKSGACYPSAGRLAVCTALKLRSVEKYIKALGLAGVISWQRRGKGRNPNHYTLLFPTPSSGTVSNAGNTETPDGNKDDSTPSQGTVCKEATPSREANNTVSGGAQYRPAGRSNLINHENLTGAPPRSGDVDGPARRRASEICKDGVIIDKLERQAGNGAVLDAEETAELERIVGVSGPESLLRRRAETLLQLRGAA